MQSFKEKYMSKWSKVAAELKSVVTINLACKAESIVGKAFWSILGVIGIAWLIYFLGLIFLNENPVITLDADVDLKEVEKPALTICSKGSTNLAFAERLGNFLRPERENLPKNVLMWQKEMMLCGSIYKSDFKYMTKSDRQTKARLSFGNACDKKNGEDSMGCKVRDCLMFNC